MADAAFPIDVAVRRRMRFRALRYALTFLAPCLALVSFFGHGPWTWLLVVHAFVVVPLLELLQGPKRDGLSPEEEAAALDDPVYDLILYLLVPLHWAMLVLFLHQVGEPGLALWERAGRVAGMGLLCGVYGINVAHELGHRAKRWERALARALLLTSLYMHFIIEHNRGHHKRVATPEDPASARLNEPVYGFWLRSIVFGFISAWKLEAARLRKAGHAPYGPRNELWQVLAWQAALCAAIGLWFGGQVLLAFVAAAVIGMLLLETVNYIEHYGLRRKRGAGGGWARTLHVHSWNSDHLHGRLMLFELTRHSDHHWMASRKYQVLRTHHDAPQLPAGYPGMMVLSLFPPLFFRVMNPRLQELVRREDTVELAV